jgi:co-chaperonin GroES (HSP10)
MSSLENDHLRQLLKDWQNQPTIYMNTKDYSEAPAINHNPYGLNLIAEGNQVVIHVDEIKDTSKGGIKLTENARKELEEAEAKKDSKLYYIIGVSEAVAENGKYAPGMWVVLRPGIDAQSVRVDGKLYILTEAYNISARVIFHEETDVESQYVCK